MLLLIFDYWAVILLSFGPSFIEGVGEIFLFYDFEVKSPLPFSNKGMSLFLVEARIGSCRCFLEGLVSTVLLANFILLISDI